MQRIPEDMRFFKAMTLGKVVVMGRETFESLPGQEPLIDRVNIVLSRNVSFQNDKVIICRSLEELFQELRKYDEEDIFIIGGEQIYEQLLPYCTEAHVTRIENTYPADKYFINLDKDESWKLVFEGETLIYKDIQYKHTKYMNTKV